LGPIVAYKAIPSLNIKVGYMLHDLDMFWQGKGNRFSDGQRIISLQAGLRVAKQNPILGVGAGDLKQSMKATYEQHFSSFPYKLPHNQLITIAAGTGIVGLLLFLIGFFTPLFYRRNYRHPLFLTLHIIIFLSFLVENTIENSVGVAFYLLWLLITLKYLQSES